MTNREKLAQMSNEELAGFICDRTECGSCEGLEMCESGNGHGNGMRSWLESEAEEDDD